MNHHHIRPLLDIFGRFGRHCQHHYQQVLCALCGWPMCSEECSRRKPHADLECRLFRYHNDYDDDHDYGVKLDFGCINDNNDTFFLQQNWLESGRRQI